MKRIFKQILHNAAHKMEIYDTKSILFFYKTLPRHENSAVLLAMFCSFQAVDGNDKSSTGGLSAIDLAP